MLLLFHLDFKVSKLNTLEKKNWMLKKIKSLEEETELMLKYKKLSSEQKVAQMLLERGSQGLENS